MKTDVPVFPVQEAVTVATSFALRASTGFTHPEGASPVFDWLVLIFADHPFAGLFLPEAIPGTGTVAIQTGIGHLPSVLSLTNSLLCASDAHPYGYTLVSALAAVFSLKLYSTSVPIDVPQQMVRHKYIPNGHEDAYSRTRQQRLVKELRALTDPFLGLRQTHYAYSQNHVDLHLNGYALSLYTLLKPLGAVTFRPLTNKQRERHFSQKLSSPLPSLCLSGTRN
jgi:hypothetical protein